MKAKNSFVNKRKETVELIPRHLLRKVLTYTFLPLVRSGVLKQSHLSTPNEFRRIVNKNIRKAVELAEVEISYEETLLKEAERIWKTGNKELAIFLFVTASEHSVNSFYRNLLEFKGFSRKTVTEIIRSNNIEAKLTWLLKLSTGKMIPPKTCQRIRKLFEIRNAFAHYKDVPSLLNEDSDSSSMIKDLIDSMGRISLRRNFKIINTQLSDIYHTIDPSFETSFKLADLFVYGSDEKDIL